MRSFALWNCLLILCLFGEPKNLSAQSSEDAVGDRNGPSSELSEDGMFAREELSAILDFLEIKDNKGISNKQKILKHNTQDSFESSPLFWPGVVWGKTSEVWHVVNITWHNNDLTGTLDLTKFPELKRLIIFDWSVDRNASIRDKDFLELHLPEKSSLNFLVCSGAGLSRLELEKQTQLEHLDCDANAIETFDLSRLPLLKDFSCTSPYVKKVVFSFPNRLRSLSLSNDCCQIEDIYKMEHLESFRWDVSRILPADFPQHFAECHDFELHKIQSESLDFSKNRELFFLTLADLPNLTALDLRNQENLEELELVNCPELKALDLRNSEDILYLKLVNCPKLRKIVFPACCLEAVSGDEDVKEDEFREVFPSVKVENVPVKEIEFPDGTRVSIGKFSDDVSE